MALSKPRTKCKICDSAVETIINKMICEQHNNSYIIERLRSDLEITNISRNNLNLHKQHFYPDTNFDENLVTVVDSEFTPAINTNANLDVIHEMEENIKYIKNEIKKLEVLELEMEVPYPAKISWVKALTTALEKYSKLTKPSKEVKDSSINVNINNLVSEYTDANPGPTGYKQKIKIGSNIKEELKDLTIEEIRSLVVTDINPEDF